MHACTRHVSGFLTDESWKEIHPHLTRGIRHVVRVIASKFDIDAATADKLLVGLSFDGFKAHLKNLIELVNFAIALILAMCENRDSSEINQAFDRFVARAGKKLAATCLDQIRRAHISPIIDQWMLILVGLAVLRDCATSRVWENSFVAVNMHPQHRLSFDKWIPKIAPFIGAAEKFEQEIIDDAAMLPAEWTSHPLSSRQKWLRIIDDDKASWDVDLMAKLRDAGMSLKLLSNMFRTYQAVKRIQLKTTVQGLPGSLPQVSTPAATSTPPATSASTLPPSNMLYHQFNPKVAGWTNMQRFHHSITVRNRMFGPDAATTPSPHLDLAMTDDNRRMLKLTPDDVNMHRVLQESTCRKGGKRRKVARRCLNALGGVSGMAGFVNDPEQLEKIRQNLKFAASIEEVKHAEFMRKYQKAKKARDKHYSAAYQKLGLPPDHRILKQHAAKLTIPQMKAVAFIDCGETLTGKAAQIRSELVDLLPASREPAPAPESDSSESESEAAANPQQMAQDDTANIIIDVPIQDMRINDCVEVYWKGDRKWYEGRILMVDMENEQFEVEYFLDDEILVHNVADYKVRMTC